MGYESFKNPLAAKIAQNARNLSFEQLMNEEFVQMLLSSKKMELSAVDFYKTDGDRRESTT